MISLCMLVYDENEFVIRRNLDKHFPYFDEIVILMDEESPEMPWLDEYTTNIHRAKFEDFSQMKNLCVSHANGEWIMFTEPDEIIEDDILLNLETLMDQTVDAFTFYRKNYFLDENDNLLAKINYPDPQTRFFKRYLKFVGKVNEDIDCPKVGLYKGGAIIHIQVNDSKERRDRRKELFRRLKDD